MGKDGQPPGTEDLDESDIQNSEEEDDVVYVDDDILEQMDELLDAEEME